VNFREALRDLDARQPESMPERGLDRIQALAESLDHPELTYPSIHVTGTNGKTTTARMVTELACAQGIPAGAFVSPHVTSVTERLSLCGEPISEEEFATEYGRLLPYVQQIEMGGHRVTYFETLTALCYVWFADKPVGLGVFEVGMGGTWDATNLIRGDVAVLCPVGLDHKELGSTVGQVASEKAGIIKEGRTAVSREQRPEAMEVIGRRCDQVGAALLVEGRDFDLTSRAQALGGQSLSIRGLHARYDDLFVPLFGEQLARNAALSVVACEALLGKALDEDAVRSAIGVVESPGRLEVVGRRPLAILDGAHNPDAAAALVAALPEAFRWERLHLVIGMFQDKEVEEVARLLGPLADRAYTCANSSPRSAPPERVERAIAAAGVREVDNFGSVGEAVEAARSAAGDDDLILVTGSFYTVADARPMFVGARIAANEEGAPPDGR
jgi:dihydrofolate synthase/folylpolyglutamate synthase